MRGAPRLRLTRPRPRGASEEIEEDEAGHDHDGADGARDAAAIPARLAALATAVGLQSATLVIAGPACRTSRIIGEGRSARNGAPIPRSATVAA